MVAAAGFEVAGFGAGAGYISGHLEHHMPLISGRIVALAEEFAGALSWLGEHPHGFRSTKSSSVAHGRLFWESMQAMAEALSRPDQGQFDVIYGESVVVSPTVEIFPFFLADLGRRRWVDGVTWGGQ